MSEDNEDKGLVVFGRDLSKIPCLRSTFLVSISSGFGVGLAHFMFTSRVKRSCDLAMFAFVITTLGYWSYCRYWYSVSKFNIGQIPKELFKKD